MILFPLLAYALFAVCWLKVDGASLRGALMRAFVSCLACVAAFTELASAFHAVTVEVVAGLWGVAIVVLAIVCLRRQERPSLDFRARLNAHWPHERWLWFGVFAILFGTLLTAWLYPPNNWDSLTYHLPRVAMWNQQHGAEFFPTSNPRQNWQMPLAEFAIWHSMLLGGSDRWANLVQWGAFVHAVLLASLVAARFGGSPRVQARAALLAATVPMAILQASSTQTDLVTACLCMAFAEALVFDGSLRFSRACWVGVCMGLALLTKGTSFILVAVFGLALGLHALARAESWSLRLRTFQMLTAAVLVGIAWVAPFLMRSAAAHGQLLAAESAQVWNADTAPMALAASVARHLASNLVTPSRALNEALVSAVRGVFGAAAETPANAWPDAPFNLAWSQHEDLAGNVLHMLLGIGALGAAWFARRRMSSAMWVWLGALLASGLCLGALLRWNPWITRLQLPLFLATAPWIAVVLADVSAKFWTVLQTLLLVASAPFLLESQTRPLLPLAGRNCWTSTRAELYFIQHPLHQREYVRAIHFLNEHRVAEVGLLLREDDPEYLLWILAKNPAEAGAPPTFRHVGVVNESRRLEAPASSAPAYVLASRPLPDGRIGPSSYVLEFQGRSLSVYRRVDMQDEMDKR